MVVDNSGTVLPDGTNCYKRGLNGILTHGRVVNGQCVYPSKPITTAPVSISTSKIKNGDEASLLTAIYTFDPIAFNKAFLPYGQDVRDNNSLNKLIYLRLSKIDNGGTRNRANNKPYIYDIMDVAKKITGTSYKGLFDHAKEYGITWLP